jgi:hypothetical protein
MWLTHPYDTLLSDLFHSDLLDALKKRGFRLGWGFKDCGFLMSAWARAGGYYLGACSIVKPSTITDYLLAQMLEAANISLMEGLSSRMTVR